MNAYLQSILRCPFCGSTYTEPGYEEIASNNGYGLLICDCGRIPVVDGIPIIFKKQLPVTGIKVDVIINLILQKRFREALNVLLMQSPPRYPELSHRALRNLPDIPVVRRLKKISHLRGLKEWKKWTNRIIQNPVEKMTAREYFDVHFRKSRIKMIDAYDYFTYRFGQPRHLVALSFASLILASSDPILDLACGFGHLDYNLLHMTEGREVIGVDREYLLLYVGKNFIAPGTQYICSDVDGPFPFENNSFSGVICVDAFHYFEHKRGVLDEALRVSREDGIVIVTSVRNNNFNDQHAGYPLSPEGYYRLIKNKKHRMVSNREVLHRYLEKKKPDLSLSGNFNDLKTEHLFSFIIDGTESTFKDNGTFDSWPHAVGRLTVNPLYRVSNETENETIRYIRTMPSSFFEVEHEEAKHYLPESITIPRSLFGLIPHSTTTPEIENLVKGCVLLGIPERY
jgi:SAM-dependent methyltransferase